MKKRNKLLFLSVLFASTALAACSSSMDTKGKGIVQLMNDNKERIFYRVSDTNGDTLPGKDERIEYVYITKKGKLKGYEIGKNTSGAPDTLRMDEVAGKNISEVKKLAEERTERSFEIDNVNARVITDPSGNTTKEEEILITVYKGENKPSYNTFVSLSSGQVRDTYYSGYISRTLSLVDAGYLLITEVSKGNTIEFDKPDGKIITEKK